MNDSTTAVIYTQAVLWLIIFGIAAVTTVMIGRVRAFYRRVAPLGALVPTKAAADHLNATTLRNLAGETVIIGGIRQNRQTQLLIFVSGSCPVSRKMVPIAKSFARRERLSLMFCGDDTLDEQKHTVETLGIPPSTFINDNIIGRDLGVDRLPFAALLSTTGAVQARGLVNSLEHLESLLNTQKTGYSSLQDFMTKNPHLLTGQNAI